MDINAKSFYEYTQLVWKVESLKMQQCTDCDVYYSFYHWEKDLREYHIPRIGCDVCQQHYRPLKEYIQNYNDEERLFEDPPSFKFRNNPTKTMKSKKYVDSKKKKKQVSKLHLVRF